MRKIAHITFIALAMIVCTNISAQEVNHELERYKMMFDLTPEQVTQMEARYAEDAEAEMAIKERMAAHRETQREASKSPTENKKWKETMNEISEERRAMRADRETFMVGILNDEQVKTFKSWKDGTLDREAIIKKMQNKGQK